MGLLDNLRDRFGSKNSNDDDYYEDDYYEDDYDDEPEEQGSGLLGNTPRPEAESVFVYTRSGRPVSNNAGGPTSYEGQNLDDAGYAPSYRREDGARPAYATRDDGAGKMNASGQLPPYVLRAAAYDDVQGVVRRVKTNQPVVIILSQIPSSVATRILDFCFGLSFGIDGQVQQIDATTFAVLPAGIELNRADVERLIANGSAQA